MARLIMKIFILICINSTVCRSQSIDFEPIGDIDKPLFSFCISSKVKKTKKDCYQVNTKILQEIATKIKIKFPTTTYLKSEKIKDFGSYRITVIDGNDKKIYLSKGNNVSCLLFVDLNVYFKNEVKLWNGVNILIKRLS
jgi:hypothetical protein